MKRGSSKGQDSSLSSSRKTGAPQKLNLESLGERVFVTHPRIFSFYSRGLLSLRHPYLAVCLSTADSEMSKPRKGQPLSRGERLLELFAETHMDEEPWTAVAEMLDSKLLEKEVVQRRERILNAQVVRQALESFWAVLGGGVGSKGISEETYRNLHVAWYALLLRCNDECLQSYIIKVSRADWIVDCSGQTVLNFGAFAMSVLELVDNWVVACEPDPFAQFLELSKRALIEVPPKVLSAVETPDSTLDEKRRFIIRNARISEGAPTVALSRTMRGTVEFVRTK